MRVRAVDLRRLAEAGAADWRRVEAAEEAVAGVAGVSGAVDCRGEARVDERGAFAGVSVAAVAVDFRLVALRGGMVEEDSEAQMTMVIRRRARCGQL